jgi:hypothetical protein
MNSFFSNIIRMFKSRRIRLVRHVAQMMRNALSILVGITEGRRPLAKFSPR